MSPRPRKSKKQFRQVNAGIAHIHTSFNNTIVAISDLDGQILTWKSAGVLGFKGSKKSTPYAAQVVAAKAAQDAIEKHGLTQIKIQVKGPGPGRDTAIRSLGNLELKITEIQDVTPIPHNGVRPRKRPRG